MTERDRSMFISSPDGTQYWDGTAWQPLTTATHPTPPAPVMAAHQVEPAPGPVSGPYGAAHPGTHAAPSTAHYRLGPAAANTYESNKWAWRIALSPRRDRAALVRTRWTGPLHHHLPDPAGPPRRAHRHRHLDAQALVTEQGD